MIDYKDQSLPVQVRKRADMPEGPYYAYFRHSGRACQRSTGTKDFRAAQQIAAKEYLDFMGLSAHRRKRAPVTQNSIRHWDDLWINTKKAQTTITSVKTDINLRSRNKKFADFLGKLQYEMCETDYTQENLDAWRAYMMENHYKASTLNAKCNAVVQVAKANDILLTYKAVKEPRRRYKAPDKEVLQRIWDDRYELNQFQLRLWLLILGTGMRRKEACFAKWEWVDEERERVFIEPYPGFTTKNGEGRMTAILTPCLKELLRLKLPTERPHETIVSCNTGATTSHSYFTVAPQLIKWLRSKGWGITSFGEPMHGCLHEARKYFGSVIASNGSIYEAQKFLGHTDPKITSSIYADYIDKGSKYNLDM